MRRTVRCAQGRRGSRGSSPCEVRPCEWLLASHGLADRIVCVIVALDVGFWTFRACHAEAFGVGGSTFFFVTGRVAESGLRHSTRNRAWGNPPWVRIPPLPFTYETGDPAFETKSKITSVYQRAAPRFAVVSHKFGTNSSARNRSTLRSRGDNSPSQWQFLPRIRQGTVRASCG